MVVGDGWFVKQVYIVCYKRRMYQRKRFAPEAVCIVAIGTLLQHLLIPQSSIHISQFPQEPCWVL
jgi:hypothetical protein